MNPEKIGRSIAFLRNQYNMTQKDLAERLNVTDKAVSKWERGLGIPDVSLLSKLSIILDTDIESILEGNLTQHEMNCKGFLVLNYPDGINSCTYLFDKPIVYFQLSFFLLAGIKEICIYGERENTSFLKNCLADGKALGITLIYEDVANTDIHEYQKKSLFFMENIKFNSIFSITGLDFLYGKDVTKYFRRLIFDSTCNKTIYNFQKVKSSMKFFCKGNIEAKIEEEERSDFVFERGIILFPMENIEDLFEAGFLLKLIKNKMNQSVADLTQIAKVRGFIK